MGSVLHAGEDTVFEELVRLSGLKPGDFRHLDLSGIDFGYMDLTDFDFTGSNLDGADLSNTKNVHLAVFDNCSARRTKFPDKFGSVSRVVKKRRRKKLQDPGYRTFVSEFDEVVRADDLIDNEELDFLIKIHDIHTQALAHRIEHDFEWLEESLETKHPSTDAIVSILIDCSGSLSGSALTGIGTCVDLLCTTLEKCEISCEILGFTTRAWRGGQSRERWIESKSNNPGRLNDLRHIIFKSAEEEWELARTNIGLLLREEFQKENIDGEAILWAYHRLIERPESEKYLIIISDGLPVDNSTLLVNSSDYLEKHLKYVVSNINWEREVLLGAIGLNYDPSQFYQYSIPFVTFDSLASDLVDLVSFLFGSKP